MPLKPLSTEERALPFGRYLLLEEIAKGGMARVYRALLRESSGFEKTVVVKRMLAELSEDPDFVARFIDEARIASTLNHSNIAQVFDFGQAEGEYYLAMELVDGPDLGTLIEACRQQQQPIPIPTALFIASRMAWGLGAGHQRKDKYGKPTPVVHRDMSPQNLLISRNGEVKVVDFGIAKATEKALQTQAGMIIGKLQYMSPEQATGKVVDVRADVFSAGCVLYQLLTGAPVFSGSQPREVLKQVTTAPITSPSEHNADVPPELDAIVHRSLERDLERRYADGSAMARDLEGLLHRLTPGYSRDDLATFIRAIVPPPPRPKHSGPLSTVATVPDATGPFAPIAAAEEAPASSVPPPGTSVGSLEELVEPADDDARAGTAGAAGAAEPGFEPPVEVVVTPPAQYTQAASLDELIEPSDPSEQAAPADRTGPTLPIRPAARTGSGLTAQTGLTAEVSALALGGSRRRLVVLGLLAAGLILGAGVGLTAARLGSDAAPAPAQTLAPGASVEHRGWHLVLRSVQRKQVQDGAQLVLRLKLDGPNKGVSPGALLALRSTDAAAPRRPRFWTEGEQETLVVFRMASDAEPAYTLLLTPPGKPPLELSLR